MPPAFTETADFYRLDVSSKLDPTKGTYIESYPRPVWPIVEPLRQAEPRPPHKRHDPKKGQSQPKETTKNEELGVFLCPRQYL